MREQEGQGATCILLVVGMSIVGAFGVKDPLKPEAVGVVSALRNMGLQCHMVTGDNWTTARIVAAQLGIIHVMAEVLPAGKAEKVRLSPLPDDTLLRPLIQAAIYDSDGAGEVTMPTVHTKCAKDICSMLKMYTDKASSGLP